MITWKYFVIVVCLWASGNVATLLKETKIDTLKSNGINYRLRNETYPINYKLNLRTRIDKGDFNFQGKVQIEIGVIKPTYVISIHMRNLNITEQQLYRSGSNSRIIPTSNSYDETTDILLISTKEKLIKDQLYVLTISYDGFLSERFYGFYRDWYDDDTNNKVYLAATQFQPNFARYAFPCYDEPKFKATFDISITHGKSYFALSNMAVKEEIDLANETKTTVFETTVKMSTYLIAFVVSNFDHISKGNQRVFTQPKLIKHADFALEAGLKILEALETYLNVSYSMNKMDQISIPQIMGAMENWGLVTYMENYPLYDPKAQSIAIKFNVAKMIAHEFAHQWFGNLVSPEWWTYIWLNEGFANLFETEILQICFPEMRADQMNILTLQGAFEIDSIISVRPMTTYINGSGNIMVLFTDIVYVKSGSVLRMVKNFLTEPVWKDGLNQYLNNRKFNSARDTDLFDALQTAVDRSNVTLPTSIMQILNTWTLNGGFPLINVKRIGEGLYFSQKRFLMDNSTDPENTLWWVPINIATKSNPDFSNTAADTWLNTSEQFYTPPDKIKPDDWFLVNKRSMYYYKVNYDSENWQKLADELSNGNYMKIDIQNRAQLLKDALQHAQDDQMDYGLALNIVKYLKRESEYVPWKIVNMPMTELYRKVEAVIETDHLVNFMRELSEKFYKTYGPVSKKGDSYHEILARPLAIKWACKSGNEQCLADTHQLLMQFIYNDFELEDETRESLICGGLRSANKTTVDHFFIKIKTTSNLDRSSILNLFSCISNEEVLLHAITNILGDPFFVRFDKTMFLYSVYPESHFGFKVLWKYITDNLQTFFTDFGTGVVKGMADYIFRPEEESNAMDIFNKLNSTFSEEFKMEFKAQVEQNLFWVSSRYNEIYNFLID